MAQEELFAWLVCNCGVARKLLLCPLETHPASEEIISWQLYEKVVVGVNREGLARKRVT